MACPRCGGHGRVPLVPSLLSTLALVKKHGQLTSCDLFELAPDIRGSSKTLANNRLEALRKLGWLRRESKRGGLWIYVLVGKP